MHFLNPRNIVRTIFTPKEERDRQRKVFFLADACAEQLNSQWLAAKEMLTTGQRLCHTPSAVGYVNGFTAMCLDHHGFAIADFNSVVGPAMMHVFTTLWPAQAGRCMDYYLENMQKASVVREMFMEGAAIGAQDFGRWMADQTAPAGLMSQLVALEGQGSDLITRRFTPGVGFVERDE